MRVDSKNVVGRGLTLIEVVVVVATLALLSAVVIPQAASARSSDVKSGLSMQLAEIEDAAVRYAASHDGRWPTLDVDAPVADGGAFDGWGVLASDAYLGGVPLNGYTGSGVLREGLASLAVLTGPDQGVGWVLAAGESGFEIGAAGFDATSGTLWHERSAAERGDASR